MSGSGSTVSVLTPTLASRASLLSECRASVTAQTVPVEHLVMEDADRVGPQTIRNRLSMRSESEWLLPLDDDDLLDPDCVETLLAHAGGADIVYPFCRVEGRDDFYVVNKLWCERSLFLQPFIPITALVRRDLFVMLGGYRNVPLEDYDFYKRAALHGARFVCVPEVLWSYRFLGQNTFQGAKAA
jgi:glycosyltransferase involved in cell wall biosynthesis